MFLIDPSAPLYPKLIGKPVDTQGDFPISVTYSPQLNTGNSVECSFSRSPTDVAFFSLRRQRWS